MTEIPPLVTVVGAKGEISFLDVFEGRRMLVAYFHMWHDGQPWEGQCIGCTYFASQVQGPLAHLHARDVTLAYLCEGSYQESRPVSTSGASTAPAGPMGRHRQTCCIGRHPRQVSVKPGVLA